MAPASEEPLQLLQPFLSYNKPPKGVPTLIGEWQEERALIECGHMMAGSKTGTETQRSIYPAHASAPGMATGPRVLAHTEQVAPANWKSTQQASYKPGNAQHILSYKETRAKTLGPRARMEAGMMRSMAADLPEEVEHKLSGTPLPPQFETTYLSDFVEKDMAGISFGSRAMKDQDGRPKQHDPTFLAETQLVPRHLADRLFGDAAQTAGAKQTTLLANQTIGSLEDVAVTIYSEAVATRRYGGNGGTRPIAGSLPFNKYTNFSKPISEHSKVVLDE